MDLPDAGAEVGQSAKFGEIESVKTVSDLFAPVDGRVAEVNDAVKDNPELVSSDAYGAGWLIKVAVADPSRRNAVEAELLAGRGLSPDAWAHVFDRRGCDARIVAVDDARIDRIVVAHRP